jgi:hypothetical protein
MATLATTHPTLIDVAKRLGPDGQIEQSMVEMLSETNEVLEDMVWVEANDVTSHLTTVRSGLPQPTWRKLNYGVQPTKSVTVQVRDQIGMLEAYAEVDAKLVDLNGNTAAFRLSEDRAHLEGMSQEMAETIFYGNEGTANEEFTGLAPRFSSLVPATAASADNVISGAGAGSDNTSIWLVVWAQDKVHGIFPKGSRAGFTMEDKGKVTTENPPAGTGRMEVYRSHYSWDMGLVVRDWRYVVRIANIDSSDLTYNAATGARLTDLMAQAVELPPNLNGRPVFYVNRRVRSFLRRQIMNNTNVNLTLETVAGKHVTMFDGIPVRRVDEILLTESTVS